MPSRVATTQPIPDLVTFIADFAFASNIKVVQLERLISTKDIGIASGAGQAYRIA